MLSASLRIKRERQPDWVFFQLDFRWEEFIGGHVAGADESVHRLLDLGRRPTMEHGIEVIGPTFERSALVAVADGTELRQSAAGFADSLGRDLGDEKDVRDVAQLTMIHHRSNPTNHAEIDQLL